MDATSQFHNEYKDRLYAYLSYQEIGRILKISVELIGSFTGWQRTPMMPVGATGYWELRLNLPYGEHRFAYMLNGSRRMADPTVQVREKDDFGGENSILNVEVQI